MKARPLPFGSMLRPKATWWLLNHVPFDGCLLVFNGCSADWRSKASDFKKRHGFVFNVHALTTLTREQAHSRQHTCDMYVRLKE